MATIGTKVDAKISEIEAKAESVKQSFINDYGKFRQLIASNPFLTIASAIGFGFVVGIIVAVVL